MQAMLSAKEIRFRYDPEKPDWAVDGVSLDIRRGEFVAVLGANGCGKSTLAKHFNAILLPESGTVTVEGMDTADENRLYDIRQKVGMVFQNPDNQIVAAIVEEDVAFGPENLGVPSEEIKKRVHAALERVDMLAYAQQGPHQLSGGQKQRVAIAGILAMQSRCIVLDEPTAMLDPIGRKEVMDTIHQLNAEGITVVLITHFMEEAMTADRVIVICDGELKMDGAPHEIFTHVQELKDMGLDVPVSAELALRLREKNLALPEHIITKEELGDALCQ